MTFLINGHGIGTAGLFFLCAKQGGGTLNTISNGVGMDGQVDLLTFAFGSIVLADDHFVRSNGSLELGKELGLMNTILGILIPKLALVIGCQTEIRILCEVRGCLCSHKVIS